VGSSTGGSLSAPINGSVEIKHAEHFENLEKQAHASKLGMWIFLATEILLFGGLFVGYTYYRSLYHAAFAEGSHHLSIAIGTINTLILIFSSFLVAISSYFIQHRQKRLAVSALVFAIALGIAFLALKAGEWHHHFEEGAYPGRHYAFAEMDIPGANLFFTFYFLMTGLHALHVIVGAGILGWVAVLAGRGAFSPEYDTPLELGTMYWHLVDIIWIFLYPLLYLA
jgi:cytochrome c oxidase subunit 3